MGKLTKIKYPKPQTTTFKHLPDGAFFGYPDGSDDVSIKLCDKYDKYNAISITTYNELYCAQANNKVIKLKPCSEIEFEIVEEV